MPKISILDDKFENKSSQDLPADLEEINSHNLYLYNKAYLASTRSGTANTKTRSTISGGGKKPFAQKGGGRARQGSIRAPQFRGGAIAFGPKSEKNYEQKINKKQQKLALLFALNEKAKQENLFMVDSLAIASGKTKDAFNLLNKVAKRDVLVVVDTLDEKTYLAFRNLPNCDLIFASELNAYLLSVYTTVVMTKEVYASIVKES